MRYIETLYPYPEILRTDIVISYPAEIFHNVCVCACAFHLFLYGAVWFIHNRAVPLGPINNIHCDTSDDRAPTTLLPHRPRITRRHCVAHGAS